MSVLTRRPARSAAEILRARGITRLVYFHSDHFEPWRYVPGRPADYALSVRDVEDYVRQTEALDFARRATLFYKANVNFLVAPERKLFRADPDDAIGFLPPFKLADAYSGQALKVLTGAHRELQLHIHHENVTWNDRMRDVAIRDHLETPEHRRYDHERFELLLRLNLDLLERQAGFDRNHWFFVHGHWALNASDPHECTIVHEMEILRRNGCLGDFTQPSGRPHTDSRLEEPYLAKPIARTKGYDRPEAEPIAAAGAGGVPAERFLIWASQISHRHTSLDHYSGFVRERMKDPETFARFNAEQSFAHDGVLYVKTHAHTMQPVYWQGEGGGPFPHIHPAIQAELRRLFDAADAAGVAVEFATVNEVFDRLMAAPAPPQRDLVRLYGLDTADPMAAVGCDIVYRDASGAERDPPTLAPGFGSTPRLAPREAGAPAADLVWPTIEERALPAAAETPPIPLTVDPALVAISRSLAEVAAAVEPGGNGETARVADGEGRLAIEMHIVRAIEAAGVDPDAPLVVVGCGNGLLATLLAARGWTATGIDRNPARLETARVIAEAAQAAGLLSRAPVFEAATFPDWRPTHFATAQAVAIVPGIANEAGLSGQASFIRALADFDGALVDLRRFFVERLTGIEQQRLVELFVQGGFDSPRVAEGGGAVRLAMFHRARRGRLSTWAGRVLRGLGIGRAA